MGTAVSLSSSPAKAVAASRDNMQFLSAVKSSAVSLTSSPAMTAATSRDIRKQLYKIAECSVCCEIFSDPRQLPCIHTYCLKCIDSFCRDRLPGNKVPCPLCRKEFRIPDGGVDSLPKNFFIQQLMDIASPTSTRCQGCSVGGSEQSNAKSATMFCVECSNILCESCVESHRRMQITRTHELVKLREGGGSMETVTKSKIYCEKHANKAVKLYCFDCKQVMCMMCFVQLHKSHECSDLMEVAVEFQKQLTGDIKNMLETVASCRILIRGRKDDQVDFNRKLDVTEKDICDRVYKLKQLIDAEKTNLLKELSTVRAERNKQMNNVVMEIEQHMSFVESMITYSEQLRVKGTSNDLAQQTNALHARAEELMKLDVIEQAINNLNRDDVTFTPATWPSQSQGSKVVGEIRKTIRHLSSKPTTAATPSRAATPRDSSNPVGIELVATPAAVELSPVTSPVVERPEESRSPTMKHVIPSDGRRVVGLTFTNNELFVIRHRSKEEIQVYETSTFTQKRTVRVAGLRDDVTGLRNWSSFGISGRVIYDVWCKALTSCDVNNCLFVCDICNVYKVDLSTDNVINWRVDGCNPSGLSVNDARHVIVTCWRGNEIREYKPNGELIRTIKPESHVTYPFHSVQLTDSQFIVSHTLNGDGVSLVDTRGSVIATYCKPLKSKLRWTDPLNRWPKSKLKLTDPLQLAVSENGSVLVADCSNNRLVVLDASLKNARELTLPIEGGLNEPQCLYFNESLGRLYVGESGGNRVVIFDNINISFE